MEDKNLEKMQYNKILRIGESIFFLANSLYAFNNICVNMRYSP